MNRVDWLIIDLLIDRKLSWLINWVIDWLDKDWLIDWLTEWLVVCCLIDLPDCHGPGRACSPGTWPPRAGSRRTRCPSWRWRCRPGRPPVASTWPAASPCPPSWQGSAKKRMNEREKQSSSPGSYTVVNLYWMLEQISSRINKFLTSSRLFVFNNLLCGQPDLCHV